MKPHLHHYAILTALFIIGAFFICAAFGEPNEGVSDVYWFVCSITCGLIGVGCIWAMGKLADRWGIDPDEPEDKV